ncbi:hypothetical protein JTE90_002448 [Oedothorax gibbosus]|uniref:Uncharacterized protein n=1 Tax=Oedothorax gibbosus TaxID=931172 RepID=A0AAV6UWM9_9ARAC|nr:hypothetical protein JTE90_002448 [Oedothorax gibbosus]
MPFFAKRKEGLKLNAYDFANRIEELLVSENSDSEDDSNEFHELQRKDDIFLQMLLITVLSYLVWMSCVILLFFELFYTNNLLYTSYETTS